MSITKKKIGLIAEGIEFTQNCIVYKVKVPSNVSGVVFCSNDIKDKDLILRSTYVDQYNLEVIFSSDNVTPQFYQSILNGTIRNLEEYEIEKNKIYLPGDIVGYILCEVKNRKVKKDTTGQYGLFNEKGN